MTKLDTFNTQILHVLNENGRISNTELADKIGLSPSACLRRVQELEAKRMIIGYKAILNKELMGIGFIAYVMVGLNEHTKGSQQDFERAIKQSSEVTECHNVTGSFEYILRVETHNLKSYKIFHTDVLGILPQVSTISTHVLMDAVKDKR